MPSVSLADSDTVLEINHHIVHLNTGHQRHGNSGDFLGNIIHNHHTNDSLYQHLGGHSTTPVLPGHHGSSNSTQETDEESLIVVYALFLPLLAALVFILIVALFVRRMRRTTSVNSTVRNNTSATQNNYSLTQYHNNGMEFSSSDLSLSKSLQMTTFSYPPRPKSVEPEFRNTKSNSSSLSSARTHHGYSFENTNDEFDSPTTHNNSSSSSNNNKGLKHLGGKFVNIINIPKRIKAHSAERNRFNIYTVPIETREQLKQIYVY